MIGERFVGANLGNLVELPRDAQEAIVKWMKGKKHFLVYCGSAGIGKTHLCAALFEWMEINFKCWRFWEERELFRRVRSFISQSKGGDYLDCLKNLIDDEAIVLNDVGSQSVNDFREDLFFDTIDLRYNSMLPTIITSNFTVSEFRKTFHPRICSRLFAKENTVIERRDCQDLREQGY